MGIVDESWIGSYVSDTGIGGTPIGDYDYRSVMHYPNYQRDGRWVFTSKTSFPTDQIAPYNHLSEGDVQFLRRYYGGPAQVCFYEHPNYQGNEFCSNADNAQLFARQDDVISSVRVPSGSQVTLYADPGFTGQALQLNGDVADLALHGFDNSVTSFRMSAPQVCFYEHPNYQGRSFCTNVDNAQLFNIWDDVISSVRVPGGSVVTVYADPGFSGRGLQFSGDVPDLTPHGFDNITTSLRIGH